MRTYSKSKRIEILLSISLNCIKKFLTFNLYKKGLYLLPLFLYTFSISATPHLIITCDCPPLTYLEADKIVGPIVEIAHAIQLKIGSKTKIRLMPWARGIKTVSNTPDSMLFTTTRNSSREKKFSWVGPILRKKYGFYSLQKTRALKYSLKDLSLKKIGVHRLSNNEEFLKNNGFKEITQSNLERQNIKLLKLGRIDYWYTDSTQASTLSAQENIKLVLNLETHSRDSYFAFNKKTPQETITLWQTSLNELQKNGVIGKILKNHHLQHLFIKN